MLFYLALVCIVIAIIAWVCGAEQITEIGIKGAKIAFVIGIVILVLSLVLGLGVPWTTSPMIYR